MTEEVIVVDAVEVDPIIQDYSKYELDKGMAVDLVRGVPEIVRERRDLLAQLNDVLALDRDDPKTAKIAAKLRISIRDNRTKGFEKWRKTTKDVYLRAGQFIDAIARKEMAINEQVEGQLEAIEKHAENLELERLSKLHSERVELVCRYVPDGFEFPNLSNMDQEVFEAYLSTKKSAFEAKIAAEKKAEEERLEKERKLELFNKRKDIFLPLSDFWPDATEEWSLGDVTEERFNSLVGIAKTNKINHEARQEKIRLENIKLKEEADQREALMKVRSEELRPYIVLIRDYNTMINLPEVDYQKQLADIIRGEEERIAFEKEQAEKRFKEDENRGLEAIKFLKDNGYKETEGGLNNGSHFIGSMYYELLDENELKSLKENVSNKLLADKQQKEKELLEAQLKKERDEKAAEEAKKQAELEAEKLRKENLAKAGDKAILLDWVTKSFPTPTRPDGLTEAGNAKTLELVLKYDGFRKWALNQIEA